MTTIGRCPGCDLMAGALEDGGSVPDPDMRRTKVLTPSQHYEGDLVCAECARRDDEVAAWRNAMVTT